MREIAESMAGRCILMHLDSFSIGELVDPQPKGNWLEAWLEDPESFFIKKPDRLRLPHSLYETLWRGFMPEVQRLDLEFVSDFHYSYQSTYIEKDIRQIEEIQNVQQFSRFVRLLGALTAQEVNYSEIGREIGITPQTAKRWLNLLSLTVEWREIPAYSNNLTKKVSLKPKGYFTDTGQVCFVQMISSPNALSGHPLYGALFETACVNEIAKLAKLIPTPPQLYHWRLHSGSECDLILERDGKLYPIEIKSKTRPNRKDARGIEAFRGAHTDQKVQKGLILAPAEEAYFVTENTLVIPWDSGWGRT